DGIRDWSVTGVQTCALPILTDLEVRVMVLDVGHMCDGVHKTHRPVEVLEGELTADRLVVRRQLPAVREARPQFFCGLACQRGDEIGRASCRERRNMPGRGWA